MIRLAVFGGVWVAGQFSTVPLFVAQAASGDTPTVSSLLLSALAGSPVALVLAWVVVRNDKSHARQGEAWDKERTDLRAELQKERDENRRLNDRAIAQAKELTTMLERTAITLSEVKNGLDASAQRTFREMQDVIDQYSMGRGREP
jgi:uncharacterized membrane protein